MAIVEEVNELLDTPKKMSSSKIKAPDQEAEDIKNEE